MFSTLDSRGKTREQPDEIRVWHARNQLRQPKNENSNAKTCWTLENECPANPPEDARQPHLATELKALLNRSSHNFFGTLFISGGIILLLRRSKEEERRQQRVVAFDGIMNLRQISAARHGRKRKIG